MSLSCWHLLGRIWDILVSHYLLEAEMGGGRCSESAHLFPPAQPWFADLPTCSGPTLTSNGERLVHTGAPRALHERWGSLRNSFVTLLHPPGRRQFSYTLSTAAQIPRSTVGRALRKGHVLRGPGEIADPRSLSSPPASCVPSKVPDSWLSAAGWAIGNMWSTM